MPNDLGEQIFPRTSDNDDTSDVTTSHGVPATNKYLVEFKFTIDAYDPLSAQIACSQGEGNPVMSSAELIEEGVEQPQEG